MSSLDIRTRQLISTLMRIPSDAVPSLAKELIDSMRSQPSQPLPAPAKLGTSQLHSRRVLERSLTPFFGLITGSSVPTFTLGNHPQPLAGHGHLERPSLHWRINVHLGERSDISPVLIAAINDHHFGLIPGGRSLGHSPFVWHFFSKGESCPNPFQRTLEGATRLRPGQSFFGAYLGEPSAHTAELVTA